MVTVDPAELVKLTEYVAVPVQEGVPRVNVGVEHPPEPSPSIQRRSSAKPDPLP